MRYFLMFFAMVSVASANGLVVEQVRQHTGIKYGSSYVTGGPVVTTTIFTVSFVSCGALDAKNLGVEIKRLASPLARGLVEYTVEIDFKRRFVDCAGPTKQRLYHVKTEKLKAKQRYVLLNPSVLVATPLRYKPTPVKIKRPGGGLDPRRGHRN